MSPQTITGARTCCTLDSSIRIYLTRWQSIRRSRSYRHLQVLSKLIHLSTSPIQFKCLYICKSRHTINDWGPRTGFEHHLKQVWHPLRNSESKIQINTDLNFQLEWRTAFTWARETSAWAEANSSRTQLPKSQGWMLELWACCSWKIPSAERMWESSHKSSSSVDFDKWPQKTQFSPRRLVHWRETQNRINQLLVWKTWPRKDWPNPWPSSKIVAKRCRMSSCCVFINKRLMSWTESHWP